MNRVHLLPITCSRCGSTFENKEELDKHTRDIERNGCKVLPQKLQKGITPEIQAKLKKRSKDGKHPSDEEKWLDIYHLIFPNSPDPASGPCKFRSLLRASQPPSKNQKLTSLSQTARVSIRPRPPSIGMSPFSILPTGSSHVF